MFSEADKLNILGNNIVLFGDAIAVLAATTEAKSKEIQDKESQELAEELADFLNITASWAELLGDYILFKAAELEFEENMKSNEPFDVQGSKLNILVSEAQVIIDIMEVQLAERASNK